MARATDHVAGLARARAREALEELGAAAAQAVTARDRWQGIAARARDGATRARSRGPELEARAARAEERAARAETRRRRARFELYRAREAERWGWRLVTISPRWAPWEREGLTVNGLRRRCDDVLSRWRRCWEGGARAGGAAAATVSVELSSGGHVHAHVLYFGPYLTREWWQRVAGCHVDVRAVARVPGVRDDGGELERLERRAERDGLDALDKGQRAALRGALREALKYALKAPSPNSAAWIAGAARSIAHPELAARWTLAARHAQLVRHYGVMREAVELAGDEGDAAVDAREPLDAVAPCRRCGSLELEPPQLVPTDRVAALLGASWSLRRDGPVRLIRG